MSSRSYAPIADHWGISNVLSARNMSFIFADRTELCSGLFFVARTNLICFPICVGWLHHDAQRHAPLGLDRSLNWLPFISTKLLSDQDMSRLMSIIRTKMNYPHQSLYCSTIVRFRNGLSIRSFIVNIIKYIIK